MPLGSYPWGNRKCFSSRLSLWAPVHSVHVQNKWWRTEFQHNHCTTRIQFDSWVKNTSWERWKKRSIFPNDINNYWGAQTLFFMFDVCWCFEIKLWCSLITFYRVFAFNYFNTLSLLICIKYFLSFCLHVNQGHNLSVKKKKENVNKIILYPSCNFLVWFEHNLLKVIKCIENNFNQQHTSLSPFHCFYCYNFQT